MSNVKSAHIKDCIFKIKELNPYMVIDHSETLPELNKYSVIVSTAGFEYSKKVAQEARKQGIKFIYAERQGSQRYLLCGPLSLTRSMMTTERKPLRESSKASQMRRRGLVTLLDGVKHPYQDGEYVVLSLVDGMDVVQETIEEKSAAQIFFEQESK